MPELKVRRVAEGKAEAFKVRVFRKYFKRLYGRKGNEILAAFKTKKFWLGAFLDGKLVGAARVEIEAGRCKIGMLAVEPAFWRKGAGSSLLAEAEKIGRGHECGKAWLTTKPEWHAYGFYRKSGYKTEAALEAYFNGRRGVLMSKRL